MNYFLGFTETTRILTISEDGLTQTYTAIKDIKPGDTVISARSGKPVLVVHCGFKVVNSARLLKFRKNSFGENCPFEDITICDSLRIIMNLMNTNNTTTISLILFAEKYIEVEVNTPIKLYNIDLQDNDEGVVVSGIPMQSMEINGLWERLNMTSN